MSSWNFADVWEAVAEVIPEETAQVYAARRISWAATSRRADGLAATLAEAGLARQDKVALYLYNCPEYLETVFACYKASFVPVNTNYRYGTEELQYLWDDADVVAVVFHGAFTEQVAQLRALGGGVRVWVHVDDGTQACPEWAVPYETAAAAAAPADAVVSRRSGDDLVLIYTGGTTGRPKGVMWRQHDLYRVSDTAGDPAERDLEHVRGRIAAAAVRPVGLAAAPLMHGTGFVFAGTIFSRGGTLISQVVRRFEAEHLLDLISEERVTAMCIVGEAFARPIVDALDAQPDRWDVGQLGAVSSAGMVWREESKQRLLRHAPNALLVDLLNSSEASGMGRSITSTRKAGKGAFRPGPSSLVLDDDGNPIEAGSGRVGRVAVRGHLPLGYYKDPAKTAQTFREIDGVRYSFPGDHATVDADGSIRLIGRGSGVVNTGGEKVYPEEVEEVLRGDPAVRDVIVVGVPDDRMGEVVACVVEPVPAATVDTAEMITRARSRLAAYKLPRHVLVVESVGRSPSGKPDYPAVKARILEYLQPEGDR